MKKNILIAILMIICFLTQSCKKDPEYMWQDIKNCNDAQHLDTTAIANKLVGTWKLRSSFCGECTDPGAHYPKKIVIAEFTDDKRFIVTENSTIVDHGHWSLRIEDSNYWGLQSDSGHQYLYGMIWLCNNQALFADSYIDGEDNLFDKIK